MSGLPSTSSGPPPNKALQLTGYCVFQFTLGILWHGTLWRSEPPAAAGRQLSAWYVRQRRVNARPLSDIQLPGSCCVVEPWPSPPSVH